MILLPQRERYFCRAIHQLNDGSIDGHTARPSLRGCASKLNATMVSKSSISGCTVGKELTKLIIRDGHIYESEWLALLCLMACLLILRRKSQRCEQLGTVMVPCL